MEKWAMRWVRGCVTSALTGAVLASMWGCHLSRADAWDDKHKQVPKRVLQTQLSEGRVTAGQAVTVRCAVTRGGRAQDDVATRLRVAPEPRWSITTDANDPHLHTLVPTTQGTFAVICTAADDASDSSLAPHSQTLRVDAGAAERWQARLPRFGTAGQRVFVACVPVDAFDNAVPRNAAGAAPGLSVAPADGVHTDADSFMTRVAGTYSVACTAQGSIAASAPEAATMEIRPAAPRVWWDLHKDIALDALPPAQCLADEDASAPPYVLHDAYHNVIVPTWRVQRVDEDGTHTSVDIADTHGPGIYRFRPVMREFAALNTLGHAVFDRVRRPEPPRVMFDDAVTAAHARIDNTRPVTLAAHVRSACGLQSVVSNAERVDVPEGADSIDLPQRLDPNTWGMVHWVVDAKNICGRAIRQVQSFIASPSFAPQGGEVTTPAWSFATGESTHRALVRQAWLAAAAAEPAQVRFETAYPPPQEDDAARTWGAWVKQTWPRPPFAKSLWSHSTDDAFWPTSVRHAGVVAHAALAVDTVRVDAQGQAVVQASLTDVEVPGEALGAQQPGLRLRLAKVQIAVTAVPSQEGMSVAHIEVDLGPAGAAQLVAVGPDGEAVTPSQSLSLTQLPENISEALAAAWTPAWTQALYFLRADADAPKPSALFGLPVLTRVLRHVDWTHRFEHGTWRHDARVRHAAASWRERQPPTVAVHPLQPTPSLAAESADQLLVSDDGINALLAAAQAAQAWDVQDQGALLQAVALTLPVIWMPSAQPDAAVLGVAAAIALRGENGRAYAGTWHGYVPVRVIAKGDKLQAQADPHTQPTWFAVPQDPADAAMFEKLAEQAALDAWMTARVNAALAQWTLPARLQRPLPEGCSWHPESLQRPASAAWTYLRGQMVCH